MLLTRDPGNVFPDFQFLRDKREHRRSGNGSEDHSLSGTGSLYHGWDKIQTTQPWQTVSCMSQCLPPSPITSLRLSVLLGADLLELLNLEFHVSYQIGKFSYPPAVGFLAKFYLFLRSQCKDFFFCEISLIILNRVDPLLYQRCALHSLLYLVAAVFTYVLPPLLHFEFLNCFS